MLISVECLFEDPTSASVKDLGIVACRKAGYKEYTDFEIRDLFEASKSELPK